MVEQAEGLFNLAPFAEGMFIGQHGSWNRKPFSGYRVVFVPFVDGKPAGSPVDVLTGFLSVEGEAQGRPVGVALDRRGALLVADDVGNVIWRVSAIHADGSPSVPWPGDRMARQNDPERDLVRCSAVGRDAASMKANDVPDDVQSEAEAAVFAGAWYGDSAK